MNSFCLFVKSVLYVCKKSAEVVYFKRFLTNFKANLTPDSYRNYWQIGGVDFLVLKPIPVIR